MSKTQNPPANPPSAAPAPEPTHVVVDNATPAPAPPAPTVGPDGKPLAPLKAGDEPRALPNASSSGQGTTQQDANKNLGGRAYLVRDAISYQGPDGTNAQAKPGDVVVLCEEDAVGLLKINAVEHADHDTGSPDADPRKIV